MAKKQALGRGLDALLDTNAICVKDKNSDLADIDIAKIEINPFQPRSTFDDEALDELAASIRELGVIQPVTVRKTDGDKYQLISGERRLRASKLAGLTHIPAYIRNTDDQGMIEMALVENIQRKDLNAIEIAICYQRLIDECNLTQESLSRRVGKSRSAVTNTLRLLTLPAKIQLGISNSKITMGHAKALLAAKDADTAIMVYDQIIKYDFSVRKVEEIIRQLEAGQQAKKTRKTLSTPDDYARLQQHLSSCFAADITFKRNAKGNGKIVIPFKNDDDLERIIAILDKINA